MKKLLIKLVSLDPESTVTPSEENQNFVDIIPFTTEGVGAVEHLYNIESSLPGPWRTAILNTILENYVNFEGNKQPLNYEMKIVLTDSEPVFSVPGD
jgi:hypothetical protein